MQEKQLKQKEKIAKMELAIAEKDNLDTGEQAEHLKEIQKKQKQAKFNKKDEIRKNLNYLRQLGL